MAHSQSDFCDLLHFQRKFFAWSAQVKKRRAKLGREINAAPADPKIRVQIDVLGGTLLALSSAGLGKLVADEIEKWSKVIKFAGIKTE